MQAPPIPSLPFIPPRAGEPADAQPWRANAPLHHHTFNSTRHGYLVDGRVETCGRAELVAHLAQHPETPGVYVPGAEGLARPEEVPGLMAEYRAEALRRAGREALWTGLFAAAGVGFLAWAVLRCNMPARSLPGLVAMIGVVAAASGAFGG